MEETDFSEYPATYRLGKSNWRTYEEGIEREWVITNGIGGYANLTVIGSNSRCFSGLLNVSLNPPADRYSVLSNITEKITTEDITCNLSTNKSVFETDNGQKYLSHFDYYAYPTYTYQVGDIIIRKSIGMEYGHNTSTVCYSVRNGSKAATLTLTLEFTMKVLGGLATAADLDLNAVADNDSITFSGKFFKEPVLLRTSKGHIIDRSTYITSMATPTFIYKGGIVYDLDVRNGLNDTDCYYTPYDIEIQLSPYEDLDFYIVCSLESTAIDGFDILKSMNTRRKELAEKVPSDTLLGRLCYSADNFIVERASTGCKSILAGLPWFLDWGRDTMISFTGLTLCTHRFEDARSILLSFAKYIKNGLLPNVFPGNSKEQPMYNTMDASMWYFFAVYKYLQYDTSELAKEFIQKEIKDILIQIIDNYIKGTDFSIHMDEDGLISGGSDLDQITWMDVRVGDWVVTPRHGKPVEINALWYNALRIMAGLVSDNEAAKYNELADKVKASFENKFWNSKDNCLYDVINDEGSDASIRPNQIIAVALPFSVISRDKEKAVVDRVYHDLYTPIGIRTLPEYDKRYKDKYIGRLDYRDGAYHMGTSWGYITGFFITAYSKVYNDERSYETVKELILPMVDHLCDGCLGGVAEIFDGSFPCTSRGCYSQAWSVAELLRSYYEDILKLN